MAVIEIAVISIYFVMPFTPAAVPFSDDFTWNYAPIAVWIWWLVSARHWFNGPVRTIDEPPASAPVEKVQ